MKRNLVLLALTVLGSMALTAQERDQDRIQDQDRTKLVMVNGEMLELRDRAEMRLKDKQTLSDGSVVSPDGTYQTTDGTRLKLKKGECLDGDGIKYRNEYQYRYKVSQENKGLTQDQIRERNQNRVQYTLVDGDMYVVRNQTQQRLNESLDLGNGVVVNPDGSFQTRDQKRLQLHDGQCLNTDGQMFSNMYQYRKMIIQKNIAPPKKMIKKGVNKPTMKKKKISTK
ncbi:DUF6799 domain-containing protein [Eudoraea sp.]|uniref:DUF6799 domain-containing protein n=1 Tax=Eudoraea sp. TaxID=1979955 RepID=UPI003C7303B3